MQRLSLKQALSQKLSPQQIQFIKLLQVPTAELESRIEKELEENPALEEGSDTEEDIQPTDEMESGDGSSEDGIDEEGEYKEPESSSESEINIEDYIQDDYAGYKMMGDGPNLDEEDKAIPIEAQSSLLERMESQIGFQELDERQKILAKQIIGSLDADGYLRRELESITNDLSFSSGIEVSEEELEEVLLEIQEFDPPGVGARTLKECLLIQLNRMHQDPVVRKAIDLLEYCFNEFSKKHYEKICKRLDIDEEELKDVIHVITKLNPKPGGSTSSNKEVNPYLMPDFIVTNDDGQLEIQLNNKNAPELKVSRSYSDLLQAYDKDKGKNKELKKTASFVKQKLDSAKWFIDAIKQRQDTLLKTMRAIVQLQYDFFLEGDESDLKPMILKDVAERIFMDISTVSRVANSKAVQTEFGIFPLKFFFSEGIATDSGEEVSNKEVKQFLKKLIEGEDKHKPLSDDKLERLLKEKGYLIARRTVAKYREQLGLPVARLRKEI
jgi:RNA polymerase sigma-54 factor